MSQDGTKMHKVCSLGFAGSSKQAGAGSLADALPGFGDDVRLLPLAGLRAPDFSCSSLFWIVMSFASDLQGRNSKRTQQRISKDPKKDPR